MGLSNPFLIAFARTSFAVAPAVMTLSSSVRATHFFWYFSNIFVLLRLKPVSVLKNYHIVSYLTLINFTEFIVLPKNLRISSIRMTGIEKASTSFHSSRLSGVIPKIEFMTGTYKMNM